MTNRDMVKDGSKDRPLPEPNLAPPTPVPSPEGDERLFTTQDPPDSPQPNPRSTRRSRGASPDRARFPGGAGITLPRDDARRETVPAEDVFICEYVRTPIGRYGGALAKVRTDDLAAVPIRVLLRRHPGIAEAVHEVFYGCANQAGEDNRNVARMAALLAGLPERTPAATINRLCA